jgi:hypothetical protein
MMDRETEGYKKQIMDEIDSLPKEFLPALHGMVRQFSEGIRLRSTGAAARRELKQQTREEMMTAEALWAELLARQELSPQPPLEVTRDEETHS